MFERIQRPGKDGMWHRNGRRGYWGIKKKKKDGRGFLLSGISCFCALWGVSVKKKKKREHCQGFMWPFENRTSPL